MSSPLDLPLESLITSRRVGTRRGGPRVGAPRRVAMTAPIGFQQPFPAGAIPAGAQIVYVPMPVPPTQVRTGGPLRQVRRTRKVAPYSTEERGLWQHDLSDADQISRGSSMHVTIGSKVEVNNLHHTVNETVLKDVFKAVGDVKSVEIEYDHTDRPTGKGYIIFEREEDARRAVSEYQGLKMADQPVSLRFLGSNLVERERKIAQGGTSRGSRLGRGRGGRGRGGRGGRGGRREGRPQLSKEQLDAQLIEMTKGDA